MSVGKRIVNYISSFRLDDRSIAVFRIILGISVLYNLVLIKLPYAVEFWGQHTIIPIDILKNMNGPSSHSIFDYIRNDIFAYVYISVAILSALLFIVGYKSKYNAIILLFLYWNLLQGAANWIGGYDFYNFHLLFWAMFLPLDNHFSIKPPKLKPKVSLAVSIILITQICWIYFATGMAKYGTAWTEGYAVKIMASDKWVTYKTAAFFANNIWVYKPLTYLTLFFEVSLPFFVLFPLRKTPIFRYIGILFLVGFHVSIFSIYDVANFSIAGLSGAALLLPEAFWQKWKFSPTQYAEKTKPTSTLKRYLQYLKYAFF
ncbi:MAG: HTTM domain-containing protein [Chitinophagales bacterium]